MPWCPNCKEEFVEGRTTCSDCGGPLVDALPEENTVGVPSFIPRPIDPDDPAEKLISFPTAKEADEVEALLLGNDIPVNRDFHFNRRKRLTGIELYIPERLMERAVAVLEQAGHLQLLDEDACEPVAEEAEGANALEDCGDDMEAYRAAVKALAKSYPEPVDGGEDETALLATVSTSFEADSVEAAVKMAGVPVWRQQHDGGLQTALGGAQAEISIFVPLRMLEEAKTALDGAGHLTLEAELQKDLQALPAAGRTTKSRMWKVIGYAALGLLFLFGIVRFVQILLEML